MAKVAEGAVVVFDILVLAALVTAAPAIQPARDDCLFRDEQPSSSSRIPPVYFERAMFTCAGDWEFYGDWYGKHLQAMGEPSFAASGAGRNFSQRVRLLVLPSFKPAYSIRFDFPAGWAVGKTATLTAVTETGAGGYGPGKKVPLWSFTTNPGAAQRLLSAMVEAGVADQPRRIDPVVSKDGDIMICGDGTTYVLETLGSNGHRLISRHQCDFERDSRLVPVFYQLINGARLTVPSEIELIQYPALKD